MTVSTFRAMTIDERRLLKRLLSEDFPGRGAIQKQMSAALARTIDSEGSLEFSVTSDERAEVIHRVPVEGEYADADGVPVHVLMHVVNGVLRELEIYKADGSGISNRPDQDTINVWHQPARSS
jgi:hypothetical protein